jgi:hypothetical protein
MTTLQDYRTKVECKDGQFTVRYYMGDEQLSIGLVKGTYNITKGINGTIVIVTEWSVGDLLNDISTNYGLIPEQVSKVQDEIRSNVRELVKEHLSVGT